MVFRKQLIDNYANIVDPDYLLKFSIMIIPGPTLFLLNKYKFDRQRILDVLTCDQSIYTMGHPYFIPIKSKLEIKRAKVFRN